MFILKADVLLLALICIGAAVATGYFVGWVTVYVAAFVVLAIKYFAVYNCWGDFRRCHRQGTSKMGVVWLVVTQIGSLGFGKTDMQQRRSVRLDCLCRLADGIYVNEKESVHQHGKGG